MRRGTPWCSVLSLACSAAWLIAPATSAAADADLAARIVRLEKLVAELQAENQSLRTRVGQLESPRSTPASQPAIAGRGNAAGQNQGNWRKLRHGATENEVEALLGAPEKVWALATMKQWYYSSSGILGPYVEFDTGTMTVKAWKEP